MTSLTSTFFLIYQITNLVDDKIYIGKHRTLDKNDSYMGSGKHLKRAITKYGLENFKKEILFECFSEEEMNAKESEIVSEEFCSRNDTYNICPGGHGGWGYVNTLPNSQTQRLKARENLIVLNKTPIARQRMYDLIKRRQREGTVSYNTFQGKTHSKESRKKISEKAKLRTGDQNSQYGSFWITNEIENKKVRLTDIPDGWRRGRVMYKYLRIKEKI